MPQDSAFLEAILADPDEDLPRLIYADWLDEQGDPRGEFIRIQCELFQRSDDVPFLQNEIWRLPQRKRDDDHWNALKSRERELLSAHEADWIQPLKSIQTRDWKQFYFLRGFVEHGWFSVRDWKSHGEEILDQAPLLDSLDLRGFESRMGTIVELESLQKIRRLTLEGYFQGFSTDSPLTMGADGAAYLAETPHLLNLREIRLRENDIRDAGLRHLCQSRHFGSLELLDLQRNQITDEGITEIIRSHAFPKLRSLNLQSNELTESGFWSLVNSPLPDRMDYIDLRNIRELRRIRAQHPELPDSILI
ncbi:TIGR02996 domain-containing protein [Thalassoroseus pseudoceratinae]|uniref:TIGR02996 domain-containing protein n=1 Tax=Thalassoroseus pseudoceratinae TaxID=2713176 RepID=UPI00142438AF|nr:TIGR02996 domain-containing protein [Thalassoroseus pseudoceratinae]